MQPYAEYAASAAAGAAMDRSRARWAEALGVATREVVFGPSTSMNTYVLAQAFGATLRPDDVVIVTNQDHEANTGAIRRAAERVGCTIREWRTDAATGLLDIDGFAELLDDRTALVTVPHASNIVGQENDIARITALAHAVGARVIVDGVSFAPHGLPDVAALDADVYLFSLYKTYSVHQGLMVVRNGLLDELPNQSHFFNDGVADKRLNPAGPDHAQVARGRSGPRLRGRVASRTMAGRADDRLNVAARDVSALWRAHEDSLTPSLLDALADRDDVRLLGPDTLGSAGLHRCPTIAFCRCDSSRTTSPTNSCSVASRPVPATTTRRGCSTASVSIPTVAWSGCRSSTTRRPPTSTGRSRRWTRCSVEHVVTPTAGVDRATPRRPPH